MTTPCDFEPLDRLARFSWDWAPSLCRAEHGCSVYHRTWSTVRLLELGGALPAGRAFFQREIGALALAGKTRVLVCGGADTGVTALVVNAFKAVGVQPRITFVDRCETPCAQNRLLLRELGLDAEVRCLDALQLEGDPVSAVVAHAFVHFFANEQRQQLLEAWARVLEPGGLLLMSSPLSASELEWDRIADPAAIEDRRQKLVSSATRAGWPASAADELGSQAAAAWSRSQRQPPALTRQSLSRGLLHAGFDVSRMELFDPVASPSNLGTLAHKRRRRAEVVAVRRHSYLLG